MKKLLVILLVLGFVAPALAAEWNFYGSARIAFFWESSSEEYNTYTTGVTDKDGNYESDTDLDMHLQGNSRIGANVKASDVVSGRFEYGTGVNTRLLYGTWNFGPGSFTVGQAYSPVDTFPSNSVWDDDNDLVASGAAYTGRKAQLKLKIGGFQAALVQNKQSGVSSDTDVMLPSLEVAYDMAFGIAKLGVFGLYQTYDTGEVGTADSLSITSTLLGLRFEVTPGAFYIKGDVFTATNAGNSNLVLLDTLYASYDTTNEEDASTLGFALVLGANFSDMIGIEAGVGYTKNTLDDASAAQTTYYVQVPITLAPGVTITPEYATYVFGDADDGNTETERGALSAFGAKFQINF